MLLSKQDKRRLQHYTGPSHFTRHVAAYFNCSYGNFWIGNINPHDCNPFARLHTLDAYMKDFVCPKNIQTRDELVTSVTGVVAVTHKSHKCVAVNVLFPKEIASAKPMIGSHLEIHLPKQLHFVAKYVKHSYVVTSSFKLRCYCEYQVGCHCETHSLRIAHRQVPRAVNLTNFNISCRLHLLFSIWRIFNCFTLPKQ
jgi:hypothetical protein